MLILLIKTRIFYYKITKEKTFIVIKKKLTSYLRRSFKFVSNEFIKMTSCKGCLRVTIFKYFKAIVLVRIKIISVNSV